MIKRLKRPCWIAICDNCGEGLGESYVAHYPTKKELLENLEEFAEVVRKHHFCSHKCWEEWCNK